MVQDPMPGWELTTAWMADASMYIHGIVSMQYVSCEVSLSFRKSLLYLCALRENDFVPEEEWALNHPKKGDVNHKQTVGELHMIGNQGKHCSGIVSIKPI